MTTPYIILLINIIVKYLNFRRFHGHESSVVACAFTPDSNFVVSGSTGGDLKVWDAKYGHGKFVAFVLECHDLGVTCCDFSPTFGSANCE